MARCWCYCENCGRRIEVGETCFDIGVDTYCSDCCKPVNTMYAWERQSDADESEVNGNG